MYAFGLLGAFTVTCVGLDIIRYRERKAAQVAVLSPRVDHRDDDERSSTVRSNGRHNSFVSNHLSPLSLFNGHRGSGEASRKGATLAAASSFRSRIVGVWRLLDFWLGRLTTLLAIPAGPITPTPHPLPTPFGAPSV